MRWTLCTWLHTSCSAPHNSSVKHQCWNFSNNILSGHLEGRGVTGIFFWGGKVIFPDFFSRREMLFPGRKFPILVDPKQICHFQKWKAKKKKKKKERSSHLFRASSYFHFQFLTFPLPFSFFSSQFLPISPFFPSLFFPDTSAKISRSEVSGGHSAPLPPTPLLEGTLTSHHGLYCNAWQHIKANIKTSQLSQLTPCQLMLDFLTWMQRGILYLPWVGLEHHARQRSHCNQVQHHNHTVSCKK